MFATGLVMEVVFILLEALGLIRVNAVLQTASPHAHAIALQGAGAGYGTKAFS